MKTKLKSIIMAALCAVGLAAGAADPSATVNEVKLVEPWDAAKGEITVDYTLANIDAAADYKVAFDITANGVTRGVTNAAAKLVDGAYTKTIETASLFGAGTIDANAKVKITLIKDGGAVQLWAGGPYWAQCNVGATKPEGYGSHLKFSESAQAVTDEMGYPWRVPTAGELETLVNKNGENLCSNVCSACSGTNGFLFCGMTSGYEDKSIFLPFSGYISDSGPLQAVDHAALYWSSTQYDFYGFKRAWALAINNDSMGTYAQMAEHFTDNNDPQMIVMEISVRAVRDTSGDEVVAYAEQQPFWLGPGKVVYDTLRQTFNDGKSVVKFEADAEGVCFCTVILGQDYGPVAFSNDFGNVTIDLNGWTIKGTDGADGTTTTAGGNGGAAITVAGTSGAAMGATFITVKDDSCVQLWENGPYFARCNVGASKPQDYGYYFWWGDIVGYVRNGTDNGWDAVDGSVTGFEFDATCPTYRRTIEQLFYEDEYIDADNEEGKLTPAHDAATAHWGELWRMPTKTELEALKANCTTEWTTDWNGTGKSGRIVKGTGAYASQSIFLPAAGHGFGSELKEAGTDGYCLSSSPDSEGVNAWLLSFYKDTAGVNSAHPRYYGFSVRPVRETADASRPAPGLSAAIVGGNGGDGNPAGKGAFAVADATGAEVSVSDPLALVTKGADGDLLISLPTGVQGYSYVVSNLTADAEGVIAPSGSVPGSATYALPVGAHVAIYCIPSAGYVATGTNPYDIPSVATDTTIDTGKLPKAERAISVANVTFAQRYPWNGLVDISFDLTGAGKVELNVTALTNGVPLCEAKSIADAMVLDLGESGSETNGVKLVWNAADDLPAGFMSSSVKIDVTAKKFVPKKHTVDVTLKSQSGAPVAGKVYFWSGGESTEIEIAIKEDGTATGSGEVPEGKGTWTVDAQYCAPSSPTTPAESIIDKDGMKIDLKVQRQTTNVNVVARWDRKNHPLVPGAIFGWKIFDYYGCYGEWDAEAEADDEGKAQLKDIELGLCIEVWGDGSIWDPDDEGGKWWGVFYDSEFGPDWVIEGDEKVLLFGTEV